MRAARDWLRPGVACALLLGGAGAHAQPQDGSPRSGAADTVVVTAPETTPLNEVVAVDKTGTPIRDIPRSIQLVPRALIEAQGDTRLVDTLRNVSGATEGGQFAFGFFDRVIIRGLNATYLNDDLPDGTSDLTGVVHTLTGVQRVEVLKGPGSALYGSTEEGGSINLVHYRPSEQPGAGISEEYGSYDTSTTDVFVTGPTGVDGLTGRIDGEYQRSDGFRGQAAEYGDFLGSLDERRGRNDLYARFEYHHLSNTPDATGIPFSPPSGTGKPLPVPVDDTYYTPAAFADQDIERVFLTDAWRASDVLTLNLRGDYTHRQVDLARNAGGTVKRVGQDYALTNRQLRSQDDEFDDFNVEAEPTWRFSTGAIRHLLITGLEVRDINGTTSRETADLPNVADIYAPVVSDPALSGLAFKCDATHSCDDASLHARFIGLYAIDQIDVTDRLRVRISGRQDWFRTAADARALVPVNGGQEVPCDPPAATPCPLVPGAPQVRRDQPFSWDVGAVYFLAPALSLFAGYSQDSYPIFNTEEPESVGQTPERGAQEEVGLRLQPGPRLSLSTAAYHVTRDNVFTFLVVPSASGVGNVDQAQVFSYRVQGVEADLNARLLPDWNLIANLAVQSPEITRYPQAPADLGRQVPSVPSLITNLYTSYDVHLPGPLPVVQASFGARYRDHEFADAGETRLVPGAALFDLFLGAPYGGWRADVGVRNITDRRNFLYGDGTGGGALPGPGRTAFVRLSAQL